MSVTVEASGTQAATIGTEHVLHTNSGSKTFVLIVDTVNMLIGDTLMVEVYVMVLSGGTAREAYVAMYTHAQTDEPIKISVPIPSPGQTNGWKATLTQVAGTGRNFDWTVVSV